MKILDSTMKEMIVQALNRWASECSKDEEVMKAAMKNGDEIPPNLYGLIKENAERLQKAADDFEEYATQNVVILDEDELDDVTDFLN